MANQGHRRAVLLRVPDADGERREEPEAEDDDVADGARRRRCLSIRGPQGAAERVHTADAGAAIYIGPISASPR